MDTIGIVMVVAIALYIAICFGVVAKKHGKNPYLYGLLSLISPVNLIILGYWAFSSYESESEGGARHT